ncbi:MAG: hypothetical protein LC687_03605, partial [Actinobacteria bacterium]|nr:hypothetical protein [Actinomycetota bacterium]
CTVTDNVKGVRKERPLHLIQFVTNEHLSFLPGELLDITIESHPKRNRQFSIAGDYPDATKDLIVRDAGIVGKHLCSLQKGDTFEAEYIGGMFRPMTDSVWISSGSGLAPFRAAMLLGYTKDVLYFSNLDSPDEEDEISGPVVEDMEIVYTYDYEKQREAIMNQFSSLKDKTIYVCGSSRYVTEMCSFLGDHGIDPLYIETDMYGAAAD